MSTGRPTLYDPSFCDKVIEWGKQGKSVTWMASSLDIHKDTIYEWEKVHPEFSDALKRARVHSQAWWEDQGQINLVMPHQGGSFNGSVWAKNMSCRFQDEWRDKTESTIQGPNGGPVQLEGITRKIIKTDGAGS